MTATTFIGHFLGPDTHANRPSRVGPAERHPVRLHHPQQDRTRPSAAPGRTTPPCGDRRGVAGDPVFDAKGDLIAASGCGHRRPAPRRHRQRTSSPPTAPQTLGVNWADPSAAAAAARWTLLSTTTPRERRAIFDRLLDQRQLQRPAAGRDRRANRPPAASDDNLPDPVQREHAARTTTSQASSATGTTHRRDLAETSPTPSGRSPPYRSRRPPLSPTRFSGLDRDHPPRLRLNKLASRTGSGRRRTALGRHQYQLHDSRRRTSGSDRGDQRPDPGRQPDQPHHRRHLPHLRVDA